MTHIKTREQQALELPENATSIQNVSDPIVQVRRSSSSSAASKATTSSSSSSSKSNSPISSRQSSDCDHLIARGAKTTSSSTSTSATATNKQQQQQHVSSESSESSSRLIRRRTVRRSYHHRALEESCSKQQQRAVESQHQPTLTLQSSESASITHKNHSSSKSTKTTTTSSSEQLMRRESSEQQQQQQEHHQKSCNMSSTSSAVRALGGDLDSKIEQLADRAAAVVSGACEQQQQTSAELSVEHHNHRAITTTDIEQRRSRRSAMELASNEAQQELASLKSVHHHESSSLSSHHHHHHQFNSLSRYDHAAASAASSASSSLGTFTAATRGAEHELASSSSTLSSRRHHQFESSSLFSKTANCEHARRLRQRQPATFLMNGHEDLHLFTFASPDVRSLVQEIGSEFAELENSILSSAAAEQSRATLVAGSRPSRALPQRLLAPATKTAATTTTTSDNDEMHSLDSLINETNSTIRQLEGNPPPAQLMFGAESKRLEPTETLKASMIAGDKNIAQEHDDKPIVDAASAVVMSKSMEKIDQRMSDLCRKLATDFRRTQKAIELLKVMIQMIEKAWSVPVCGDDLGFRLCESLRQCNGLDTVLGFIQEADERESSSRSQSRSNTASFEQQQVSPGHDGLEEEDYAAELGGVGARHQVAANKQSHSLRLDLAKVQENGEHDERHKDTDSDIHTTSDLGLGDSASAESLCTIATGGNAVAAATVPQTPPQSDDSIPGSAQIICAPATKAGVEPDACVEGLEGAASGGQPVVGCSSSSSLEKIRRDELIMLSAHLLARCITLDNRDYIVRVGLLNPVVRLACKFTIMTSVQSKRLLKRSALVRQSSHTIQPNQLGDDDDDDKLKNNDRCKPAQQQVAKLEHSGDLHSAIGTEILQHLFKHSDDTCALMCDLGALQAILYACRSANVQTLRNCATALANLALYGGPHVQQIMIEHKAHLWLFPLAFNEDDNVQYYACLAIVTLAANQEIEADVLKSSTLDLVEPFVTSHEPRKFAESTTSHIHGQSAGWLRRLIPLLESKRVEALNLACFHFAMEAHIKREQEQTHVFARIQAIEPLRRAAGSPLAIASKFACQALRLIGEPEPHRLSQQVPLWTTRDVCAWVSQIGCFDKFVDAFQASHVDGDLLLQLDEEMLKSDLGLTNGLLRRFFMRELAHLKRLADFSSVDRSGLGALLASIALGTKSAAINTTAAMFNGTSQSMTTTLSCEQHDVMTHPPEVDTTTTPNTDSTTATAAGQLRQARDYLQYIYPILAMGITKDNIHLIDCDQLLAECKVSNMLHRIKLRRSICELQRRALSNAEEHDGQQQDGSDGTTKQPSKTLDVFISYRRSTGSQLASLLKVHLDLRGFSVFLDVDKLKAGKFDNKLLESIKMAKNFIIVLSPNALDRCIGDHECKDWVHKEIVAAMTSNCNIIPILDNFQWPDSEQLPEDMRQIGSFNGVRWIHDYQDACVDKIVRFIQNELNSYAASSGGYQLNRRTTTSGKLINANEPMSKKTTSTSASNNTTTTTTTNSTSVMSPRTTTTTTTPATCCQQQRTNSIVPPNTLPVCSTGEMAQKDDETSNSFHSRPNHQLQSAIPNPNIRLR